MSARVCERACVCVCERVRAVLRARLRHCSEWRVGADDVIAGKMISSRRARLLGATISRWLDEHTMAGLGYGCRQLRGALEGAVYS